jgi:hypothetical protein
MCALNPKRQMHFTLSVYTSIDMIEEEFRSLVLNEATVTEIILNKSNKLRWHINEKEQG